MRTSSAILLLVLLAGCGGGEQGELLNAAAPAASNAVAAADDPNAIDCAIGPRAEFARSCTLDRAETAEGAVLTVRQSDGGFRRLRLLNDGRGVEAADGSQPAKVTIVADGVIEVAIGDARYRLPARVGPVAQR